MGSTLLGLEAEALCLAVAALLICTPAWAISKFVPTVVHELGHVANL